MLGGLGLAMFLVFSLAAIAIVGSIVFASAAHRFLVVLEQTAAGAERITWPDEPYVDHLWKGFYLAWLAALWLVPGFLLSWWLGPAAGGWKRLLLPASLFSLFFPLSLLSSLSASSRMVLLRGDVVRRLLEQPAALAGCYLLSATLLAGACWLFYLALFGHAVFFPLAALALILFSMIYARTWGRIAWLTIKVEKAIERRRPKADLPLGGASTAENLAFTLVEEEADSGAAVSALPEAPYLLQNEDGDLAGQAQQPMLQSPISGQQRRPHELSGRADNDRAAEVTLFNPARYFENLKSSLWLWLGLCVVLVLVRQILDNWPS
jgi:hypothetical protein